MKLIDTLRKLGILRYGTAAGTYTSAKDAPTELMLDDVFDARKDLVGGDKQPPRKARGPFFWVAAAGCSGCLVISVGSAVILMSGLFLITRGTVEAVRGELKLIGAGDLEAAHAGLSRDYRSRLTRQQFERMVAQHPSLEDHADTQVGFFGGSATVDNDSAHLKAVLVSRTGTREPAAVDLVWEEGVWRISDIRFEGGPAPAEEAVKSAPASRGRKMQTETVAMQKEKSGGSTQVTIKTRTRGFELRQEGAGYLIDLAGDLETTGPGGMPIPGLSKPGFYGLIETVASAKNASADFKTDLTFRATPPGRYTVRITIRDRVGGGRDVHHISFDLP